MTWARVKDGELLNFVSEAPNVDQGKLATGKPRILPVEIVTDEFDPISQVQEGPTYEVEETRVVKRFTSRAKNEGEIEAMKAAKDAAIEAEFVRLYCAPINHTVGGQEYTFHADAQARENITGVLQMYYEADRMGSPLPDPRTWTPFGSSDPISITRAELAVLGMMIGARKDALYTIKKARQKELAAMTDPAEIDVVDPQTGWDIA
jgi:hypothetical protein